MSKVIPLGAPGAKRYFAPATETTARHDGWMMVQMADAGLMQFLGKDVTEDVARDIVITVMRSGKWEYLLAGALVEQEKPWTPDSATANAEWFAGLTDPESKAALQSAFIPAIAGFFHVEMPSLAPSPNASVDPKTGTATASQQNGVAPSTKPEVPALAANGSLAPASSPKGTRNKSAKSLAGRSSTSSTRTALDSAPLHENSTTPS